MKFECIWSEVPYIFKESIAYTSIIRQQIVREIAEFFIFLMIIRFQMLKLEKKIHILFDRYQILYKIKYSKLDSLKEKWFFQLILTI